MGCRRCSAASRLEVLLDEDDFRERIAIIVHHICGSNSILSFLDSDTAGLFNRSLVEISRQDRQYSQEIS